MQMTQGELISMPERAVGAVPVAEAASVPPEHEPEGQASRAPEKSVSLFFSACPFPMAIWRRNADGLFCLAEVNAAAQHFFGPEIQRFLGEDIRTLFVDLPDLSEMLERTARENISLHQNLNYPTRTQPARHLRMKFYFIPVSYDEVILYCEDKTSGMKSWEERKRAQSRFETLFQSAPVGIYQTGEEGRLEHVNERLVRMYGYQDAEDMELRVADPCELIVDPEQRSLLRRRLMEEDIVRDFECLVRRCNGESFWVSRSVRVAKNAAGQIVSSFGFELDISERKSSEALREEIERVTRHDLKSPLNAIVGLSNFMAEDEDEEFSPDQRENLRLIEHSGNTMLNMINLSLAVYRMERGTYRMEKEMHDVFSILREVLFELRNVTGSHDVEIKVLYNGAPAGPECSQSVRGEKLLVWAMFYHLVRNAVEASGSGGVVQVALENEGDSVRLSIHNDGVVPVPVRESLFEKFVTFGKNSGTGFGAYCARLIAWEMGSDIRYQTSEETGTTMICLLPAL